MKRRWLTVALFACLLGIVCSSLSLRGYLQVQKNGVAVESFCAVNDYINCDIVEASSYAHINGVPVAGVGLIYYIFILIFAAVSRFSKGFKRPTIAFAWWTTIPSIFSVIYFAYISLFVLHALCLTCIGMYLANLILFISLYLAMGIPFSESFSFLWGYWVTLVTRKKKGIDFLPKFGMHLLAMIIIFGIGMVFVSSAGSTIKRLTPTDIETYLDRFYRQSKYDLQFDKDTTPMWGRKGAPITIVEFSDFRCPYCRTAAFTIKPFLTEYKNDIAYYFLNYPLDSECNHYMQHQMHPGACLGAKGAICAEEGGQFWKYHDELFRTTNRIDDRLVLRLAKRAGLNEEEFKKCLSSPETELKLKNDIETARRIYITGTPSVYINDRNVTLWRSPDILRAIVKKELKK